MRETFLPFALPDLGDAERAEVMAVLDSGWITTGPKTRQFERDFAACVGAKHAVAVNSCTAALHLALEAAGVRPADLVLTTPYTFAATAEVIRYFDATPVFVDVDPEVLNIDPDRLRDTIRAHASSRVKAIIPVHMAGYPCNLDAIYAVAAEHGVAVIEDAAHAFGTTYQGRPIGAAHGSGVRSAVCFSFYATKTLTTAEGGMLCTADDALAERCRLMSLHGISKDAWRRYTADGSWYYEITEPGYKYNMTDLAAALGLAQLRKAHHMQACRAAIARRYTEAFAEHAELQTPSDGGVHQHAWHLYMLRLHLDRLRIDRARFITELKQRNIGASVHFIPLHIHPYYARTYGYRAEDFPIAYREYQREISLPIYSAMSDADVEAVIDAVGDIVRRFSEHSREGRSDERGDERGDRRPDARRVRDRTPAAASAAVPGREAGV